MSEQKSVFLVIDGTDIQTGHLIGVFDDALNAEAIATAFGYTLLECIINPADVPSPPQPGMRAFGVSRYDNTAHPYYDHSTFEPESYNEHRVFVWAHDENDARVRASEILRGLP